MSANEQKKEAIVKAAIAYNKARVLRQRQQDEITRRQFERSGPESSRLWRAAEDGFMQAQLNLIAAVEALES